MTRLLRRLLFLAMFINLVVVAALVVLKRNIPSLGDEDSDELALAAIMDGASLRSRAKAFRGGSSLVVAGAQVLDLRDAQLGPGGGTLQLRTVMGATSVVLPREWPVEIRGEGVMGAFEDRTAQPVAGAVQSAGGSALAAGNDETVDLAVAEESGPGDALRIDGLALIGQIVVDYEPAFEIDGDDEDQAIEVAPTVV